MVLYTKDFIISICFGVCFIFMVGTIITQQIYISRLGDVDRRLDSVDKNLRVNKNFHNYALQKKITLLWGGGEEAKLALLNPCFSQDPGENG